MTEQPVPSTQGPTQDEVDFEADAEELAGQRPAPSRVGAPSLIVHDLHVTYRIYGTRKQVKSGAQPTRLQRMLRKGREQLGGITEVEAVRGVSFVARHGESVGIVGRNGSGKSTLLRAVAGLLPPVKGDVYVSGEPSLLGVNAVLMPELSGAKNIMLGGLALGLTPDQVQERMDEIVEFAGIGDFVYMPMKAYSSGMSARLRFAISSAARPDLLMVDEALATGDAEFREKSKARIDALRQDAGTVFLVSHSTATIQAMCTRALWLEKGELKMDGSVDDVCEAYKAATRPSKRTATGTR